MPLDSRSLAWATLAHKRLPPRALVTLLRAFGDPAAVLGATASQLASHVTPEIADAVRAAPERDALDATSRWLADDAHHLIAWDDRDYPRALLDIGHAPPVVFFIGARQLLNRPAIAIVGSRHATPQGRANARDFAHALAEAGLTVVSGLALGVDAAAHEGALETEASTLAFVGTGSDRVYPARNRDLARRPPARRRFSGKGRARSNQRNPVSTPVRLRVDAVARVDGRISFGIAAHGGGAVGAHSPTRHHPRRSAACCQAA